MVAVWPDFKAEVEEANGNGRCNGIHGDGELRCSGVVVACSIGEGASCDIEGCSGGAICSWGEGCGVRSRPDQRSS